MSGLTYLLDEFGELSLDSEDCGLEFLSDNDEAEVIDVLDAFSLPKPDSDVNVDGLGVISGLAFFSFSILSAARSAVAAAAFFSRLCFRRSTEL